MTEFINNNQTLLRLTVFVLMVAVFMAAEFIIPRRPEQKRKLRWHNNFMLVALNSMVLKVTTLVIGVHAAQFASQHGLGIFNLITINPLVTFIGSIIILDCAIYWQHRIFHRIPILWRLHQVHHTDIEYDISTGLRFHPLEIILSFFIKYLMVLVIGVPMVALIVFEIILNATAIFNHANIKIPNQVDKILRWFIVTPDMHRVHHSIEKSELNNNYGFNVPVWDYIFGSYLAQPKTSHQQMLIGVSNFRQPKQQQIMALLRQPMLDK